MSNELNSIKFSLLVQETAPSRAYPVDIARREHHD